MMQTNSEILRLAADIAYKYENQGEAITLDKAIALARGKQEIKRAPERKTLSLEELAAQDYVEPHKVYLNPVEKKMLPDADHVPDPDPQRNRLLFEMLAEQEAERKKLPDQGYIPDPISKRAYGD